MHAQQAARVASAKVLRLLMRVLPSRRLVVVAATPPDEGNAVELVRGLTNQYDGSIVWLDPPEDERLRQLGLDPDSVIPVAKRSVVGVWSFLTAEAVFFTHGLFGYPKPVPNKVLVNLWHGDGPKDEAKTPVPSTYVVTGSTVFGHHRAASFGVDPVDVIVSGLPRIEQLRRPATADQLVALGLTPDRPFAVWLPTFRRSSVARPGGAGTDSEDAAADTDLAAGLAPGVAALTALGVQVVVKPHPLDATWRGHPTIMVLTDADLASAGTTLYSLLAASAGLLTDYSSVWTDYVALDRPIGFFIPDARAYAAGRGLYPPDALRWLPGRTLETTADFDEFGREILGTADEPGRSLRARAREHFGLVQPPDPTTKLLEELVERGVLTLEKGRTSP